MITSAAQCKTQQLHCSFAHNTVNSDYKTVSVLCMMCMGCQGISDMLLVTSQEASGAGVLHWDLSHNHAYGAR